VHHSLESPKKSLTAFILEFKVVQGCRYWCKSEGCTGLSINDSL